MSFLWGRTKSSNSASSLVGTPKSEIKDPNLTDAASLAALQSLRGYPGHLTDKEQAAFVDFKKQAAAAGLYSENLGGSVGPTHSDATICRFLRARKFDTAKALKQFKDAERWRKQNNVEKLYPTFDQEELEQAKRYYPTWTGRRDKRGLPLYVYRLGELDSKMQKELNKASTERRYQRIVSLYEYMFKGVLNLCIALSKDSYDSSLASDQPLSDLPASIPSPPTLRKPTEISSVSTIIDLSNVSMTQLWSVRGHLQQASTLANANYPETLDSIFVVHAPSFFPTVWGWVKGWFDPPTVAKIKILGNPETNPQVRETLLQFIEPENLPKQFGGELDWKTGDPPSLDAQAKTWLKDVMGVEKIYGPLIVDPEAKSKLSDGASASSVEKQPIATPPTVAANVPLPVSA